MSAGPPEDFGHEPMDVYGNGKLYAVVCFRCRNANQCGSAYVDWPCTSAVVLGIAPREEVPR